MSVRVCVCCLPQPWPIPYWFSLATGATSSPNPSTNTTDTTIPLNQGGIYYFSVGFDYSNPQGERTYTMSESATGVQTVTLSTLSYEFGIQFEASGVSVPLDSLFLQVHVCACVTDMISASVREYICVCCEGLNHVCVHAWRLGD